MKSRPPKLPHEDFHEIWWIYSPVNGADWAGLRIASFIKSMNGVLLVIINNEVDPDRVGMRIWEDIVAREHWYKVKQIPVPTTGEVFGAALKFEEKTDE